ncbi:MAG: hypothetical protein NWR42_12285 [Desulfobacterales bacterium]|nr:hypothetical protein [Desulfobacterales bacterium]
MCERIYGMPLCTASSAVGSKDSRHGRKNEPTFLDRAFSRDNELYRMARNLNMLLAVADCLGEIPLSPEVFLKRCPVWKESRAYDAPNGLNECRRNLF